MLVLMYARTYQTVLIPEASGLELLLIFLLIDLLEDIFEATVVFLQNRVLGGHVLEFLVKGCRELWRSWNVYQRHFLLKRHLEGCMRKSFDRLELVDQHYMIKTLKLHTSSVLYIAKAIPGPSKS